jgi:hypothetical protein
LNGCDDKREGGVNRTSFDFDFDDLFEKEVRKAAEGGEATALDGDGRCTRAL